MQILGVSVMKSIHLKMNALIIIFVGFIFFIILFIDNESLNSLFINYHNNLVVNEVAILNVDYDKVVEKQVQEQNNSSTGNEENASSNNSNSSNSTSSVTLVNKSNVAAIDYWAWPTDQNYTITTYYSASHKALDIYQGYGGNIYAANNGVVTSVKGGCVVGYLSCNGKGGNYVVINHNHNNYYTVYMHMKDIHVKVGDVVSRGQVIGTMGNTGNVIPVPTASAPYLGTHLHFCLYIGQPYAGGYAINPMKLY